MANPQKRKGDAAERELSKLLTDLLGFTVRRKLGAGRADDEGDLDGLPDCTAQAKNYADVLRAINQGLKDLEVQQSNASSTHGVLFVRRRGGQWIAVQTLEQWATTFRETI
jgi:Holliday junction resolvase